LSFVGATAIGTTVPAGGTWNGCPPDWTIQGGVCKPYRHGPWDYGHEWYR
jgi:hypothetical protein